ARAGGELREERLRTVGRRAPSGPRARRDVRADPARVAAASRPGLRVPRPPPAPRLRERGRGRGGGVGAHALPAAAAARHHRAGQRGLADRARAARVPARAGLRVGGDGHRAGAVRALAGVTRMAPAWRPALLSQYGAALDMLEN